MTSRLHDKQSHGAAGAVIEAAQRRGHFVMK
jgi:hypothetical protein